MAAIITQKVFASDSTSIESSPEQHAMTMECEALELIELRYQGLWARLEMEAVFMREEQADRRL